MANEDRAWVDCVLAWNVNGDLLLAIINLMEDKANAENDINNV